MPVTLDQTRQQSVFERVRSGILSGAFPGGARLPPTRVLAGELGVARQTVVLAYERLAAEGYLVGRVGSGTFVASDLPDSRPVPASPGAAAAARLSRRGALLAGIPASSAAGPSPTLLAPGIPAPELFPARAWAACAAQAWRGAGGLDTRYPDPQGMPELRQHIAAHLAGTRGLLADPAHIVITAGTQQALRIAAELLLDPGDEVWVEDPGYIAGRGAMLAAGAVLAPVRSDADGLDVADGMRTAPNARMALVAPTHGAPLGGAMPVGRRLALLDWAARGDAWVLEDDCDSEFRWSGKPLPPLATLDRAGRVVYCGTFSKTLAPALRLGFALFPAPLVAAAVRARTLMDRGPNGVVQAAAAEFMRRDLLAPHVRRMRTEYARRRGALLEALARHCPGLAPVPAPGGLHMAALLPDGTEEEDVVRRARGRDLGVAPLGAYYAGPPGMQGLVMGFASTPPAMAAEAARRLAACTQA